MGQNSMNNLLPNFAGLQGMQKRAFGPRGTSGRGAFGHVLRRQHVQARDGRAEEAGRRHGSAASGSRRDVRWLRRVLSALQMRVRGGPRLMRLHVEREVGEAGESTSRYDERSGGAAP